MIFFLSEQNRLVHKVSFSLYLFAAQSPLLPLLCHFSKLCGGWGLEIESAPGALERGKKSRALYSLSISSRMFTTLFCLLVKASEVGNNVTP